MEQNASFDKLIANLAANSSSCSSDNLSEKKDDNVERGLGNTIPKGKSSFKARKWIWTWNNYSSDDKYKMEHFCMESCIRYTFQPEVGANGTKHLQGFWEFKHPRSFESLKNLFPKMHIEKCNNAKKAEEYCRKLDTRAGEVVSNVIPTSIEDDFDYSQLRVWQKKILDIIKEKPDPRKIYWFYEPDGRCGKSSLCRSLLIKDPKGTLLAGGKGADIKFAVATHVNTHGPTALKVCLFDFERSIENAISWSGIEQVKNGAFFSGKYESSCIAYNKPHIICFANHPPDLSKLSLDRWDLTFIDDNLKKIDPSCRPVNEPVNIINEVLDLPNNIEIDENWLDEFI